MNPTFPPWHIRSLIDRDPEHVDWEAVAQRVETHPEEVKRFLGDRTVLHDVVVKRPPVKALQAVIRAYPGALVSCDEDSDTPLNVAHYRYNYDSHFAQNNEVATDVIRTILQESRKAVEENIIPETSWRHEWLETSKLLDQVYFWETSFPLMLFRLYLEELPLDGSRRSIVQGTRDLILGEDSEHNTDYWERMNLLLMSISMNTVDENELNGHRFLVLHAFLEMICGVGSFERHGSYVGRKGYEPSMKAVIRVLNTIQARVPDQFRTRDSNGSLPLQVVARTRQVARRSPSSGDEDSGRLSATAEQKGGKSTVYVIH